jgi:hypothetical protein
MAVAGVMMVGGVVDVRRVPGDRQLAPAAALARARAGVRLVLVKIQCGHGDRGCV